MSSIPRPRVSFRRLAGGLGVAALFLTACGGEEPEPSALDGLPPEELALVTVEADWQCDVTRFAFDELSELEEIRAIQLAELGIDEADYAAFVERLSDEPTLRDAVNEIYEESCVNGPGSTDPDQADGWAG